MKKDGAEELFYQEVRDKKRSASGVHGKKGLRGHVGTVRFPSDLLSGEAKKAYIGKGKVVRYYMGQEIMGYSEFSELDNEKKADVLQEYRQKYTNQEILDAWGISIAKLYSIIDGLGLPKREKRGGPKHTAPAPSPKVARSQGLHLGYNKDDALGAEISQRLEGLAKMLEGSEGKFGVKISIREKMEQD